MRSAYDWTTTTVEEHGEPDHGERLIVSSHGLTDPGRARSVNEDHFVISELTKCLRIRSTSVRQTEVRPGDGRAYLFVVADGMGGHQGGSKASALTVQWIEDFIVNNMSWPFPQRKWEEDQILDDFQRAFRRADDMLFEEADRHSELLGMGTTVTTVYCFGHNLYLGHVGDSRCYLLRGEELRRLTSDHTWVERMLQEGALRRDEIAQHPFRHVITNAVGGSEPGVQVDTQKLRLLAGDQILLCTDGLTEMVSDEHIQEILQSSSDVQAACESLVARANARGGRDNITCVLARFDSW
jgi:protein phosphatase